MAVHLFLSPHLDDAVLSCGGLIHSLKQRGERVVIITVMAGEPPDDLPDTPSLQAVKARWGNGHYLVSTRRLEDARAARALGAFVIQMPFLECLFRTVRGGDGSPVALYPQDTSPFEDYDDADEARLLLLDCQPPISEDVAAIYAPLGTDQHVDHRFVRDWALVLTGAKHSPALKFYEEYPSIRNKMALTRALTFYQQHVPSLVLQRETVALDDGDVAAKIQALRCYQTHVQILWQNLDEMEKAVRDYVTHCGEGKPAERLWSVNVSAPTQADGQTLDIIP